MKQQIKYKSPEILMIDCDKKVSDQLLKEGFNVETGSFGSKYLIEDKRGYMLAKCNENIGNITEKDVIIIDMKQDDAQFSEYLDDARYAEDGSYVITKNNQKEFNPINYNIWRNESNFSKLRDKDSIIILIADDEVKEKYTFTKRKSGYFSDDEFEFSNYGYFPFSIPIKENGINMTKFKIADNEFAKEIFKNYKGKINSKCTFSIQSGGDKVVLTQDIYGSTTGYFRVVQNQDKTINMLIVLPRCENINIVLNNILTEFLPKFFQEMFADFVKDNWINNDEYMLPEIKKIRQEKQKLEEEYKLKLEKIEDKIKQKQEENKFLYDIISSTGTGDKLLQGVISCLKYLEYPKVQDWDKEREDGELEEDLHIYTDENNFFIGEVKGVNGPAIEDDCNEIVKYKSRNCDKLGIPRIHGAVFFNYHKNVEPNKREELGFTKKEIGDAIRDKYTLIGTYELFKAIRLCQENIIKKEDVRKSIETPGLFTAIPTNFEKLGKMEDILDKKKVICIPLECEELKVGDELLVHEDNNYYKCKVTSLMVDGKPMQVCKKCDKAGIMIDKEIPNKVSAQIYLIK